MSGNQEEFTFDKFMDRILIEEGKVQSDNNEGKKEDDDPRRRLIERYTERAHNSIRYIKR